ncbi:MAG TPA: DUF190 domain-containing protein [Dermatophilaceae bacterium]|nr:DUF190 domain-containing protein [Dermatophilaceae bacterium]
MTLLGPATRLTIVIGESDQWHHRPLYSEIVHRAHAAGLGGATVLHGIEGFGKSSRIHTTRLLSLSEDLPVLILIVSSSAKVRAFLPEVESLVTEGLVMVDDVEVVKYAGRQDAPAAPASPGSAGEAPA